MTECDYVIVGAGSAGCVLAARLSEDAGQTVLLAEAGGRDWNPLLHIPLGSGKLLRRGLHGWKYVTEPNPGLGGRRLPWTRGRVLGGSSAINGMVYVRGHPSDYDGWAMRGDEGWSFRDVLPYFRRAEGHRDRSEPNWGTTGPLGDARAKSPNPLYEAFIQQAKMRLSGQRRYRPRHRRIRPLRFQYRRRPPLLAARAYLAPARSRANLQCAPAVGDPHPLRRPSRGRRRVRRAVEERRCGPGARSSSAGGTANSPQLLMPPASGRRTTLRRSASRRARVDRSRKKSPGPCRRAGSLRDTRSAFSPCADPHRPHRRGNDRSRCPSHGTRDLVPHRGGGVPAFVAERGGARPSDPLLDQPRRRSRKSAAVRPAPLRQSPGAGGIPDPHVRVATEEPGGDPARPPRIPSPSR